MRFVIFACVVAVGVLVAGCGDDATTDGGSDTGHEILDRYDPSVPGEGDRKVLEQMKKAGADMSKPTDIRWYVYMPRTADAQAYAAKAREAGWKVEVDEGADENSWLCLCSRDAVPSLETIGKMKAQLASFAGGTEIDIDGWEAAITK
ncbi:MAG: ribonuclease E inhibitor RraB [Planctomycetota bacterium]|nr:ribonuclease E inhibitor RraB [Planctomycetota bacterium]